MKKRREALVLRVQVAGGVSVDRAAAELVRVATPLGVMLVSWLGR